MKDVPTNHRPTPDAAPGDNRPDDAIAPKAAGEVHDNPPAIEREPAPAIHVGAGGMLVVPREDFGAVIQAGAEIDLAGLMAQKIRKPDKREWIVLHPGSELTTTLLPHRSRPTDINEEYFYVSPELRGPISDALKLVRVLVYYSLLTRTHALWIVKATVGNSWYESIAALLGQPPEFFGQNAIRVAADRDRSAYRVWHKSAKVDAPWPTKPINELLGEALGASHFINTPDHPLYVELTEGTELV